MYLFSRRGQLAPGNTAESIGWAVSLAERVTQVSGLPFTVFGHVFSPDVGTLVWSTFVTDLAELQAANDKLGADQGFITAQNEGANHLTGGMDDLLLSIVHGEPDPDRDIEYVGTVESVCATGSILKGIELGVGIAQAAETATGLPTMFGMPATGSYGAVSWLTGYANVDELQSAQETLNADPAWLALVDEGVRGVYSDDPAASQQRIFRRMA